MLEQERPDSLRRQSEGGRVVAGHLCEHEVGLGGLDGHKVAVLHMEDPHLRKLGAEGVGRDDRPLPAGPLHVTDRRVGQRLRVFDVEAEFLAGRLGEHLRLDDGPRGGIAVGQDQDPAPLGRGLHRVGGRGEPGVLRPVRRQHAVEVVVGGAGERERGRRRGGRRLGERRGAERSGQERGGSGDAQGTTRLGQVGHGLSPRAWRGRAAGRRNSMRGRSAGGGAPRRSLARWRPGRGGTAAGRGR
jgi:hypothetical protein